LRRGFTAEPKARRGRDLWTFWTNWPANPQRCGEVAVAGYGLARDASFVHPSDPRAIGDIFLCERHAQLYEKKMAAGSKFGEFIPKVGGATN
jgi:hypothetical protein